MTTIAIALTSLLAAVGDPAEYKTPTQAWFSRDAVCMAGVGTNYWLTDEGRAVEVTAVGADYRWDDREIGRASCVHSFF